MKEVTEWDNNPREMWVWDGDDKAKKKKFVVYIKEGEDHRALATDGYVAQWYKHCAEIGEPKTYHRMTNKELSRWLSEKPDRECLIRDTVYPYRTYQDDEADDTPESNVFIREGDEPWRAPLVVEETI